MSYRAVGYRPCTAGARRMTDNVTVREMAGGFSTFINDGVYGTRTYTKVTDSEQHHNGEYPNTDKGFTNRTDYYVDCLQNVTATRYRLRQSSDGVETGGKTKYHHLQYRYLVLRHHAEVFRCGMGSTSITTVWMVCTARNAAKSGWPLCRRCMRVIPVLVFDSHPQISKSPTVWIPVCWLSVPCRAAGRAPILEGQEVPTETCSHQNIENKYDFREHGRR